MVFTSDNHRDTVRQLKRRRIPFREVHLIQGTRRRKAIELTPAASILIQAGRLLTDN